jgi:ribosomal protein L24
VDTACSGAFLPSCTHDRVTEYILQAGLETVIAGSLNAFSRQRDSDIQTYHVPYLPRRVYIRAPGIAEIQELLKFSAYGQLVSRASRVLEDLDLDFLHGTKVPDVPCVGSWVRILQPGIYRGDLAVVFSKPSAGDIVTIAVVPRLRNKKRKGKGNARPPSALLDPIFLAKSYPPDEENIHHIDCREFSSNGLEFLRAASAHALKMEPRPHDTELFAFQSSLFLLDKRYQLDAVLYFALTKAFSNESRRLWRTGDRVQILRGVFKGTSSWIREIDEENGSLIVEFDSPKPTSVEVSLEDVERQFLAGDKVRVALGEHKGRTGSIVVINDGVGTIVEGTANEVIQVSVISLFLIITYFSQFQSSMLFLESDDLLPSFATTAHPAAASMSNPKPSHEPEASKGLQMLRGRDPRLGKQAAVYVGQMKGYQGRLIDIGRNVGTIEFTGRHPPQITEPLNRLVLL